MPQSIGPKLLAGAGAVLAALLARKRTRDHDAQAPEGTLADVENGDVIKVDAQDGHLTFERGEGTIPAPTERIHMALPQARSHWTPDPRPAGPAGDGLSASD